MDLRGASDYFKTRWKWRSEPEWYREAQARREERKKGAPRQPATETNQEAPSREKSFTETAREQAVKAAKNKQKTREKGDTNGENPQNTDNTIDPEKGQQTSKKARRFQQEQRVLGTYLQQILETLESVPASSEVSNMRDRTLEMIRAPEITPEKLLDFDKDLDKLQRIKPALAPALLGKKTGGTRQEQQAWERVDAELKHLRQLEQQGEKLEFSANLSGTTLGILEAFLGPAGPLLRIGRELYEEYKDDAKGLLSKFAKLPKFIGEKAAAIRLAWARRATQFARRFPKLAGALDKFGKKLSGMVSSLLDKLPIGRGKMGKVVGAAKAVGGFLSSDIGKATALLGAGGLMSFFRPKSKPADATDTTPDADKKDSAWSVSSIAAGLKEASSKVGGMFSELFSWMGNAWSSMTTWVSSAWDGLVKGQQAAVLRAKIAKDYVEEKRDIVWDAITGWFSELWSKIKGLLPESVKKAAGWVKDKTVAVVEAAKSTPTGAVVSRSINRAATGISDALGGDGRERVGLLRPTNVDDVAAGQKAVRIGSGVDMGNLNPGLTQNFYSMVGEYNRITGRSVQVNSAARTKAQQAQLRASNPGKAAPPGYSMHEYGLALDINSREANEMEQMGLLQKYGFVRPVGGEPWHLEPAAIQGVKAAIRKGTADIDVAVAAGPKPNKDTEGVAGDQNSVADAAQAKKNATAAQVTSMPDAVPTNKVNAADPPITTENKSDANGMPKSKAQDTSTKITSVPSSLPQPTPAAVGMAGLAKPMEQMGSLLADNKSAGNDGSGSFNAAPGAASLGKSTNLASTLSSAIGIGTGTVTQTDTKVTQVTAPFQEMQTADNKTSSAKPQTENYGRVNSQTKAVDGIATLKAPSENITVGNHGATQVPTNKIGFYLGDMSFLTMNLGVGA